MIDLKQLTTLGVEDIPLGIGIISGYGIYRLAMTNLVLKRIAKLLHVKNQFKFVHRSFDLIHYTCSALLGLAALVNRPYGHCIVWSKECGDYFKQCDSYVLSMLEKIYFLMFTAYYVVDVFFIWTASDRGMMITHHTATLSMIFFSIALRVPVLGLVIMLLHDVVDLPLYTGKILLYLGYNNAKDYALVTFAIMCTWFRMLNYPTIVYHAINNASEVTFRKPLYCITCGLLCVLLLCHILWYWKIIEVVLDTIHGKQIRDNRSDSD